MILWRDHAARDAILATEFKRPTIPFADFEQDAIRKGQAVSATYVGLWNMRRLSLYRTPQRPRRNFVAEDFVADLGTIEELVHVEDWLQPAIKERLHQLAMKLVLASFDLMTEGVVANRIVDATVFVDWLGEQTRRLRVLIERDFTAGLGANRRLRLAVREWARKQGLEEFVANLDESLAAQLAYRLAGQVLFYYSLRRHVKKLPALSIASGQAVTTRLRTFWDAVRQFDYEALYEQSPLEEIPLSAPTEQAIGQLVEHLASYEWDGIDVDVLGSIFENMIPPHERRILGQYYTPTQLVDLIICLSLDTSDDIVLDPGVGTGTFLYRTYDRLRRYSNKPHPELLEQLWAVDISAFPAELAVINLYRLDLKAESSFPRVAVRDFFDMKPGEPLTFPPAKRNPGSTVQVEIPLPQADAIIGNPPYVRSQQLDDLDPRYKRKLDALAKRALVFRTAKFDAFAYYILHASHFLKPGGRLGFVVSGAWLNSEYGAQLQSFILSRFQPIMILMSEAEIFFPSQDVNVVVLIAERLSDEDMKGQRGSMRFVTLTRPLADLVPERAGVDYWRTLDELAADLETLPMGQHADYRIAVVDAETERQALLQNPREPRDWTRHLRVTPIYVDLFGA